jgi:hypothetical protein
MNMINILYSVAGGIIILIIRWVWNDGLPFILQYITKSGPIISGKWKTIFKEEGKIYHETAIIKQRGTKIFGKITLDEEDIVYNFNGTFKNLILSGTYADEANFERGTILLKYVKKGKFLGQNSFFSKTSDKLVSSHYEWNLLG